MVVEGRGPDDHGRPPLRDLRLGPLPDRQTAERVVPVGFGGVDGEHPRIIANARMPPTAQVTASATRTLTAPRERMLECLRDYSRARPSILPDNYSRYSVEAGGEGAGTVFSYPFKSGPTER